MKTKFIITIFLLASIITTGFSLGMEKESELAKVMKQMMAFIKSEKENIDAGKPMQPYPKSFNKVHTAKVTAGKHLSEEHKQFADDFLKELDVYYKAENLEARKSTFNNVVYSCISCHKVECPGPISSIRQNLVQ
jgi:hypothetical protein